MNTAVQDYALSLLGGGTITDAVTMSNTGAVTIGNGSGDTTTFTGGLTATAPSSLSIAGTIQSAGIAGLTLGDANTAVAVTANTTVGGTGTGTLDLGDATLVDGVTLIVGTGIANTINLDAVSGTALGTSSNLTINTTGTTTIAEAVGTDIGTVTLTQSGGTTFNSTVNATTVTLTDTTGTIQFDGALTAITLNTAVQDYALSLLGGGTITDAVTMSNTGAVTIGNGSGDTTTFTGGLTATAPSSLSIAGTIQSAGIAGLTLGDANTAVAVTANTTVGGTGTGTLDLGDATLVDGVTLIVGTGIANTINLDAVSGTALGTSSNLTINTTGTTTIAEAVGTDIGTVTLTQSGGTTFNSTVNATTVTLTDTTGTIQFDGALTAETLNTTAQGYNLSLLGGGTITNDMNFLNTGALTIGNASGDTTTFVGGLSTTGNITNPASVNIAGTIATTNTQMDLGTTTLDAATILSSGSGAINLSTIDGGQTLTINSTGTVTTTGALGGSTALTSLTTNAGGTTVLGGNVTTTGAQLYNDAVTLTGDLTFITTNNNVTFGSTVEGQTSARDLTVSAGTGTTTFSGTVGATNLIDVINVTSDELVISATMTGQGAITLAPSTAATVITLGTGTAGFDLSAAEIGYITTTNTATIGSTSAGAITIGADITPSGVSGALHLKTGGGITGTLGGVVETNLALTASGSINMTDATTDVDTLAISDSGQTVTFTDFDGIDLGSVAGVTGVTATTFNLTTGGAITDSQA